MIIPLQVATDGYLTTPLNIAVNGYLIVTEEEEQKRDGGVGEDDIKRYLKRLKRLNEIADERERKKYKVKGLVEAREAAQELLEDLPIEEEQIKKLSVTTKYTVSELNTTALLEELNALIDYYTQQLEEITRLREEDDVIALLMLI